MEMKLTGKILVADDNASNQLLMRILLNKLGLEATIAANGKEAIEKLGADQFDLILMDIQMPIMNGYEATEAIRKSGNRIPIIALTASTSMSEVRRCKEAGCNEYLQKPINKQSLFDTLKQFLNDEKPTTSGSSGVTIDEAAFISSIAGDDDLQPVIDMFMEDLPRLLGDINNANSQDDINLISGLAHELKGASGSAGFEVLQEYAQELEKTVKDGQLDTAHKAVDQINDFCRKLIEKQNT